MPAGIVNDEHNSVSFFDEPLIYECVNTNETRLKFSRSPLLHKHCYQ